MRLWAALFAALALLALSSAQTNPPPGAPNVITVQFIIRDFVGQNPPSWGNRTTHPDFQRINAQDPGIVNTRLGPDRKPSLNASVVSRTWTNATTFSWAWNDRPGVNIRLTRLFNMTWNTATGLYEYSNSNFFPINNDGFGNYTTGANFHFCLEYHTQFVYRGTESFTFTGDDDVYFFVNNQLFVDLGGVHGAITASRSLTNTTAVQQQFGMVVGSIYNFDFFFCERHTSASNLRMATNILLNDCPYLDACGFCSPTPPVSLINPCNTINCGNGTCSCQNASCICQPGWVNGPLGNCSQRCGDGIIQGSEQCDPPGPCCTSSCLFAPANTACPSAGRTCVNYVCTGNSTTCGVPRPIGSPCNGTSIAPQCQEFQCTAADGSTCALVPNAALTCSDNDACTTDVCTSLGTCVPTPQPCQPSVCRLAGTCSAATGQCSLGTPRADGTGCGPDPGLSICVQPTCVAGTCTNTSKPVNTPCGGASADGCSTQVCNGNGQCTSVPIVNAQSTKASCAQPAAGSCLQSLCSGTGCANFPIADGSACTNASLTGLNSCQRLGCSAGSCVILPTNEGATCTDGGALDNFGDDACNVKVCQSGQCVRKANTAVDGNTCNIDSSGVNPEQGCRTYTCSAGTCTRANTKEGLACVNASIPTDACTQLQCVSGTCTKTPANVNGVCQPSEESGCTFYRCNSTGSCVAQTAVVDLPCGSTANQCSLSFCTAVGTCVAKPVTCNTAICNGLLACNTSTGVCELPSSVTVAACCGNGQVDAAGEECDNPNDPCCIDCKFAAPNTPCSDNECNPKVCTGLAGTQTVCTDNLQNGIACTSAAAPSNQCKELRCGGGTCAEVDKADNTACTLTNVPFCGQAVCRSGACQIVADAAKTGGDCTAAYGGVGGVPQCNKAVCSGTECVLTDDNEGGACTALPALECRDRKCSAGSCVYTFDAFPISPRTVCSGASSSSKCLLPGCDGAGTCILLNATAGTDCDLANNPECNVPRCNGGGVCTLVAINVGSACTTSRDQQCQTSSCDVNGNCVVANVTDGAPCSRTDVGQCQDSVCQGGACVLQSTTAASRVCTPTPDPAQDRSCFNYFCQADGTCETPSNKPDGTACTDTNLCDTDTCQAGVCIHAPAVVCNTPTLPCENPDGTCISAFGNCTYTGRGQYAACTPRASEVDPRCNASVVGAYRCSTGAPDSACVPSCFSGGVCGDGIVQEGEECDWGDPRTGGPCCNVTTCLWFQELAPCNNTDPEVVARVNAQIANLSDSSGLPELCFVQRCVFQSGLSVCTLGLDATVSDKCSGTSRSSNNRTAILASVIPGALLALCLAGLGFFLWRRAQKAAEQEWLQEYLNSGNVRVENNAAFVATQNSVNNAAFQPDGR